MKKIFFSLLLLNTFSFLACQKVIQVNIKNAASQIVITGEVTNQSGPYYVYITKSVDYYADNIFPAVSGATVIIKDTAGLNDSLTETTPGVYETHTNWQGQPGVSYTLTVIDSGTTYTATSTMPQPVHLDSVGFVQESDGYKNNIINAIAYFQDPPGVANYYQFTETINGSPLNRIFLFDDRLSDGKYISQPVRDDSAHLQTGYQLSFSMYSIDKNVYQYLSELDNVVSTGSFSSVTPANPDTNLSGGALGYFSAHTVQTIQCTVNY
jgi:Domain of unknown function (DUF4249)